MNNVLRRDFLRSGLGTAAALTAGARTARASSATEAAIEIAHAEIWRRLIDRHGIMLDFSELDGSVAIPEPDECRLGKPNALGWWSPIENGAFFNGLYMDAAVGRWRATGAAPDAQKARRLAQGLMLLASVGSVKGFVGRGFATDGRAHYPMGSDDQTLPWFYGLWRFLDSGIAAKEEKASIAAKLVEVADEIVRRKWELPAEDPFRTRGSFSGFLFYQAPRLLFVAKLIHKITGDPKWDAIYQTALRERGGEGNRSRLELCERGMVYDHGHGGRRHSWTTSNCVAAMRALWELEEDRAIRAALFAGLQASATVAMESLPIALKFDNDAEPHFESDWRKLNASWVPQASAREAQDLAEAQSRELRKLSPRRGQELSFVREPVFAAWIATLAPDKDSLQQREADLLHVLGHYRYDRLRYSQFFPAEAAWWRLMERRRGTKSG